MLRSIVESALRPVLGQWLDAHLPGIVERLVKAEIERIARERASVERHPSPILGSWNRLYLAVAVYLVLVFQMMAESRVRDIRRRAAGEDEGQLTILVLTVAALLESGELTSSEEISRSLAGNLCRCTGYIKIYEAVELAAARMRGEKAEPERETLYGRR